MNFLIGHLKKFPFLYIPLRQLYLHTFLRITNDSRYYRGKLINLLRQLSELVTLHGLIAMELTADGEFFLKMSDGIFVFYNTEWGNSVLGDDQSLDFRATYPESKVEMLLFRLLKDGMRYFDIGANNGYFFSLKIAKKYPNCRVWAFEPNERILVHLKKNIVKNHAENVTVVPVALSDQSGTAAPMAIGLGASAFIVNEGLGKHEISNVECDTLDNFVSNNSVKAIDIMKVDIEGGEYRFLMGAQKILSKFQPIIIMELKERLLQRSNSSVHEVVSFLRKHNYLGYYISGLEDAIFLPDSKKEQIIPIYEDWLEEIPI